jgi:ankyrin repeat protein
VLKKLQREGADFNGVDYLGRAPLHVICNDKGNLEMAKFIVKENVNIDLLDSKQRSPLYIAIESDNWEVAELLCNEGATVIANQERLAKMLC